MSSKFKAPRAWQIWIVPMLLALLLSALAGCAAQHNDTQAPSGMAVSAPLSPAQAQTATQAAQAARAKHGNPVGQ
jgi:hypothetical protein